MRVFILHTILFVTIINILSSCFIQESIQGDNIVAEVNGEAVYFSEIEKALENVKDNKISFDTILRNSVNELLVIQMAPIYETDLSKEEFEEYLIRYQNSFSVLYDMGIEIYGSEAEFIKCLFRQEVFRKTKEYLIIHVLAPIEVTSDELYDYCKQYSVDLELLSEEEHKVLYNRLHDEKEEQYFFDWMLSQWEYNDIKIYYGSYKNTSSP